MKLLNLYFCGLYEKNTNEYAQNVFINTSSCNNFKWTSNVQIVHLNYEQMYRLLSFHPLYAGDLLF